MSALRLWVQFETFWTVSSSRSVASVWHSHGMLMASYGAQSYQLRSRLTSELLSEKVIHEYDRKFISWYQLMWRWCDYSHLFESIHGHGWSLRGPMYTMYAMCTMCAMCATPMTAATSPTLIHDPRCATRPWRPLGSLLRCEASRSHASRPSPVHLEMVEVKICRNGTSSISPGCTLNDVQRIKRFWTFWKSLETLQNLLKLFNLLIILIFEIIQVRID